ncbi:MAG TPA: hypothetical protein VM869_05245 [Enhygromyxa sp.]|nr:hypothetical protein [Enhygromyxa sp.]
MPDHEQRDRVSVLYSRVRAIDPELVAAAAEQDTELIRAYLQLPVRERLRRGFRAGQALSRLRDARRPG